MPTSSATRTTRPSFGPHGTRSRGLPAKRAKKAVQPGHWIGGALVRLAAATVIPVLATVGVSVALHSRGYGSVASIAGGAGAALLVLTVAAASISWQLTGKRARFGVVMRWIALPAVLLWCAYALFHLERANAKTTQVRQAYTSLHPVLRLALSTAILADGELVVTDASRTAADYRRMGLPVFERTLHYEQKNGWVHAVDLRTIGHSEPRNILLAWYFRAVGLRVVRHVGTADHLHVELPVVKR
jgi:hypothetical protein